MIKDIARKKEKNKYNRPKRLLKTNDFCIHVCNKLPNSFFHYTINPQRP